MTFNLTNFVIITFTMIEGNFENSPLKITFNLTVFGIITFTMVEENFENSPLKMP